MAAMDLKVGGEVIGMMIGIKRKPTARKLINTALDGTPYIQNTGRPIIRYEIACYCGTAENRNALDDASNYGDIVTITTRDEVDVRGYIENDTIEWREWIDGHGVGRFILVAQ